MKRSPKLVFSIVYSHSDKFSDLVCDSVRGPAQQAEQKFQQAVFKRARLQLLLDTDIFAGYKKKASVSKFARANFAYTS